MKQVLVAISLGALVAACGSSGSGSEAMPTAVSTSAKPAMTAEAKPSVAVPASAAPAALTPGGSGIEAAATLDGAKTVVKALQAAADPRAEMAKLKPGLDELKLVFSDTETATAIAQQTEEMYSKGDKIEFPKGDATVFCAPSDDVKAWKPEVEKNFPGGYKRVGPKLNGGFQMCKFKVGGIAYDSLVNIKGRWFLVIKPFRAIKG